MRRVTAATRTVQAIALAAFALSLPAGSVAVFGFDADRGVTADVVGVVFFAALVALLLAPWIPGGGRSAAERTQSMVLWWFGLTFTTHLTWELAWLVLHHQIASSPDAPWAYPWWMYIDGGDSRYADPSSTLLTQEFLSVLNGLVGFTGLWLWWRSQRRSAVGLLLLMSTAVVHLYSTTIYFGTEIIDGYPHVEVGSVADFWIKFWLLNGIWLVVPWIVLGWGWRGLRSLLSEDPASGPDRLPEPASI